MMNIGMMKITMQDATLMEELVVITTLQDGTITAPSVNVWNLKTVLLLEFGVFLDICTIGAM